MTLFEFYQNRIFFTYGKVFFNCKWFQIHVYSTWRGTKEGSAGQRLGWWFTQMSFFRPGSRPLSPSPLSCLVRIQQLHLSCSEPRRVELKVYPRCLGALRKISLAWLGAVSGRPGNNSSLSGNLGKSSNNFCEVRDAETTFLDTVLSYYLINWIKIVSPSIKGVF